MTFYQSSNVSSVASVIKDRINESIRLHKNQLFDFNAVKQCHGLWFKLTSSSRLTLLRFKQSLTMMCTFWNSVKYAGNQITQMMWLRKLCLPRLTHQVYTTMKLVFYLPNYQLHPLLHLESQQISMQSNLWSTTVSE